MTTCRRCRQSIRWEQRAGKSYAVDPDGGNHWASCRALRAPRPGAVLHIKGREQSGAQYVESCGRCDVAPWEFCACSETILDCQ